MSFNGINISRFQKNQTYPIGVDMGYDALKMVQLKRNGKGAELIAGGIRNRPEDVQPGGADWQKWVIKSIHEMTSKNKFYNKKVIASLPVSEVVIEHIKLPKGTEQVSQEVLVSKMKHKIDTNNAVIKHVPLEGDNILVIATEREKINRYLAIYEKAKLQIDSLGIWPIALTNSYASFFGRRKIDVKSIVMLLDIEAGYTNVAISRHKNLLFARSLSTGAKQLESEEAVKKLSTELAGCRREFVMMQGNAQIERLILLSGQTVSRNVSVAIARHLEIPAQTGDCLAAVAKKDSYDFGIDRRESKDSWATAFGLSLS
jgi:Tfp pilus assembly PilM family ATPase